MIGMTMTLQEADCTTFSHRPLWARLFRLHFYRQ